MRVRAIGLHHFRNVAEARLEFSGRLQFLVGANGQGKTNLLEAVGFITALRSFRSTDPASLIQHGQREAALACDIEHEVEGPSNLRVDFKPGSKVAWLDGARVTRLAEVIGRFPTVVFSSQDQQLVRGSPAGRRRWLDLALSATDAGYLKALQAYHRALAGRNALLRRGASDAELDAFENVLADEGVIVIERRRVALAELGSGLTDCYARIADRAEPAGFAYAPHVAAAEAAALRERLARGRERDRLMKATSSGPHRDDFEFLLQAKEAKAFASEGQQRALVLSLRLAQAAWFRARTRLDPVLLADDVLGELDPARRERFWAAVSVASQIIATGTAPPQAGAEKWQIFNVAGGAFTEAAR